MNLTDKKAFLSEVSIFQTLDPAQLDQIADMAEVESYGADAYICHEGEIGDSMYLILDGSVSLEKDGLELGTYRRRGDCVGEMTLLDEQPRSASLRAKTDVQILYIKRAQFDMLLSSYPEATRELFKVLSTRLRESLSVQIGSIRREAAIEQEIRLSAQIQQALLPCQEIGHDQIQTAGYCRPAQTVGGDYYDYLTLGPDRMGLIITDVMGHGFHSAMFVAMVRSCLQTQIRHADSVPAVMNSIRQTVEHLHAEIYMSMCYAVINTTSRTMSYANAGHPFPLHYRYHANRLETLESTCIPLGLMPEMPFPSGYVKRRKWDPGDVLLFYSDGVTEAVNSKGEEFGEQRLHDLFAEHVHKSPDELKQIILDEITVFCDDTPQNDDITLVVVQV